MTAVTWQYEFCDAAMGGGIDAADTSPTSLIVLLKIYAAHCSGNRTGDTKEAVG
jgi:hypothetical protein